MKLLALDPGGTTGVAWFTLTDERPLELLEAGQWHGGLEGFIAAWSNIQAPDLVVAESFVLDGRTQKPDVTPLRIEGALRVLAPCQVVLQRNVYKSHAPDELLKRAGLWQKGKPHANDAIRHAIAWAKTKGHRPTMEWLWPMPERLVG